MKPLNKNRMNAEKQQTVVEWLKDTLYPYFDKEDREYTNILFKQAKEMDKQQRIELVKELIPAFNEREANEFTEQYYNKTFKSE